MVHYNHELDIIDGHKDMKTIVIRSQFGHEIMAVNFAKAFNLDVVIAPNKDEKKAYSEEAEKIFRNMSFFYNRMSVVPFEEKDNISSWDIIAELKTGKLDKSLWEKFAISRLIPENTDGLPTYQGMSNAFNTLFIPQKLISDGACGITAEQQSLPLDVFNFLKGKKGLVLGQHFNKVNDIESVKALVHDFNLYVPGLTENSEVLGIRGIQHKAYYNMYTHLNASVGIAGTHTWLLLTMFPEVPQIILYNNHGVERWKDIEQAYQNKGYNIHCIGFDENTDLTWLSQKIEKTLQKL